MNGIAAARSSIGIAGDEIGAIGARRSGVPDRVGAFILCCPGLTLVNRSVAEAFNGLIAAPNGDNFMGRESNGESRIWKTASVGRSIPGDRPSVECQVNKADVSVTVETQ
jgi:hypothetical protein